MTMISKDCVTYIKLDEEHGGQRLDNLLFRLLKGVPQSHIYRIIRTGQVRINKARVGAQCRVQIGDILRLPPIKITPPTKTQLTDRVSAQHKISIIYEDECLLVIDKPAGLAVHGGSGVNFGIIELLRKQRPHHKYLELVHRLDRDTSGLLLVAKKRNALMVLHQALRAQRIDKRYLTMIKGAPSKSAYIVTLPLTKYLLPSGERRVKVDSKGQAAHTAFKIKQQFSQFTLLEAQLKTGRTHQIRVHLSSTGCPILGDDKYGDINLNHTLMANGLKRMFLHAWRLTFQHPLTHNYLQLEAPLPNALKQFVNQLDKVTQSIL